MTKVPLWWGMDVDSGGSHACEGQGHRGISVPFLQFCFELETVLKHKGTGGIKERNSSILPLSRQSTKMTDGSGHLLKSWTVAERDGQPSSTRGSRSWAGGHTGIVTTHMRVCVKRGHEPQYTVHPQKK